MKKFIAVILALCTALSLLSVSAFADGEKQYVVAGTIPGSRWQVYNEDFLMTYNPDLEIYTFAMELEGDPSEDGAIYEFKVCAFGSWDESYNFDGSAIDLGTNAYVSVKEDGSTVIFTFDKSKAGCIVVPPGERDTEAPVFKNIEDGNAYCVGSDVSFSVTDNKEVKSVTVNGTSLTAVDGIYSLDGMTGTLKIVASDAQLNSSSVTVTINEHNFENGECTNCKRDIEAPAFKYIEDGRTYCTDDAVGFAVTDNVAVKSVTVNGNPVTPVDGMYFIDAGAGTVTIVASDAQSNSSSVTITVNGHNYEDGECTNCGAPDPNAPERNEIFDYIVNYFTAFAKSCIKWLKEMPVSLVNWFKAVFGAVC